MGPLKKGLLFSIALWFSAGVAAAQEVVAVLSSQLQFYQEAFQAFQQNLGHPVSPFTLPSEEPRTTQETRLVVAFGARAALRRYPEHAVLIYCMAPGLRMPRDRRAATIKVSMSPRAEALIPRLREIQPKLTRLLVFWVSEVMGDYLWELKRAARGLGLEIQDERLEGPQDLPGALRGLNQKPEALWLPPDPLLLNAESFVILKEYSWSQKVPLYAPSEGFAEKGATVSIAVSFAALGQAAATAARQALSGSAATGVVYPDSVTVTVNLSAATGCGLSIPPETLRKADKVLYQ